MKYIKTFEKRDFNVEIGDYVIAKKAFHNRDDLSIFLKNNIGQVKSIFGYSENLIVRYDNIPENLITKHSFFNVVNNIENDKDNYIGSLDFYFNEIMASAKSKDDLEYKISVNKYNL